MKRRTKGTGTIVKIGDVYYGRISSHGKIKKVRLSKNQREAESLWKEWIKTNMNHFESDSAKHPIEEVWPIMYDYYLAKDLNQNIIDNYKFIFKKICEWTSTNKIRNVEDLTKGIIVALINELTDGQSDCIKRNYLYFIRGMFNNACPSLKNPTLDIKIKKTPTKARIPFTDEEIEKILSKAEMKGHCWKVLIEVGLYTGLRRFDCVHLKTENVVDDVIMLSPVKTKQYGTIVRIPLHPTLKAELESLKIENGFYFPEIVKIYKQGTISCRLRNIFKVIGAITESVEGRKRKVPTKGFHALRATFITRLAENGVSLPIMESIAGHLNPRQTMHYTHPDESIKQAAINALPIFDNRDCNIDNEIQKVIDSCKKQIASIFERVLRKKVDVTISTQEIC